jgi:hypothetical protein
MRALMFICSFFGVIGLAFWAYQENYTTQTAVREVRALHAELGAAHDRLQMLRAEWAYQNRPDRLADLADLNFDRLGLLPLRPEAFGQVTQIIYPIPPILPITDPIELSSDMADTAEEPL